jgi:hypothetical protein
MQEQMARVHLDTNAVSQCGYLNVYIGRTFIPNIPTRDAMNGKRR